MGTSSIQFRSSEIIEDVLVEITRHLTNVQASVTVGILKITDNLTVIFEIQVHFV